MKEYEKCKLELKIFDESEIFTVVSSAEATDDRFEEEWWTTK